METALIIGVIAGLMLLAFNIILLFLIPYMIFAVLCHVRQIALMIRVMDETGKCSLAALNEIRVASFRGDPQQETKEIEKDV